MLTRPDIVASDTIVRYTIYTLSTPYHTMPHNYNKTKQKKKQKWQKNYIYLFDSKSFVLLFFK